MAALMDKYSLEIMASAKKELDARVAPTSLFMSATRDDSTRYLPQAASPKTSPRCG
jgi:hypothetical protein